MADQDYYDQQAIGGYIGGLKSRIEDLESALREALELVEDYAQYVLPFLLEKWDHAGDMARLKAALGQPDFDGKEGP